MEKVLQFLKDAGVYYLATADGDQPRVRPFGTAHIFEGRLYIQTGRKKILAIGKAFHGRTSGAVAATDNPSIQSAFNKTDNVTFTPLNDIEALKSHLATREYAALIMEGIQGVAGIYEPSTAFWKAAREACDATGTMLIADEIQSGYGRSGRFFAHQYAGISADIITVAKGMGNGFPIGAVLLSTFGGNHLACTAALAVLKVMKEEKLVDNAATVGQYLMEGLKGNKAIKELRGKGLMIGIELAEDYMDLRDRLLFEKHIFTGGAGKNVIRLLPPLMISKGDAVAFLEAFNSLTL